VIIDAFHATDDLQRKVALLSIVKEYRTPHASQFLATVLASRDDQLWKLALDGLVTVGGETAREVLNDALGTLGPQKREWVMEALQQIGDSERDES
jgi:hypothetical protein